MDSIINISHNIRVVVQSMTKLSTNGKTKLERIKKNKCFIKNPTTHDNLKKKSEKELSFK